MILNKDEQLKVYTYYFGEGFKLGTAYLSPLSDDVRGKTDRFSSFNIYRTKNNNLRWKDYGGGGISGDALELIIVMEKTIRELPENKRLKEAVRFFNNNIKNERLLSKSLLQQQRTWLATAAANKPDPVPYYDDKFTPSELKYFCRYPRYITEEHLKRRRIYGLRGIDWGDGIKAPSIDKDPAFIWDLSEKGDMSSWKAYRPLTKNKRYKWKSHNLSVIPFEGYYLLPEKGDNLFFTSGYKDGIIADKLGLINGNPTGEGAYKSILEYQSELNYRFKDIYIIFDGDEAGRKAAEEFSSFTGWKVILLDYPILTGKRLSSVREWNNKNPDNKKSEFTKDLDEVIINYDYKTLKYLLNQKVHLK